MTDTPIQVLLIEDDEEIREELAGELVARGLRVDGLASGEAALAALERRPADVVLLDIRIPGMGGLPTLEALRERFPATEVVVLTGHADVRTAVRAMEAGAFDYLMKPADPDELVYRVQDAFQRKKLR